MALTSRIPHPKGSRFVMLHEWAVRAVGRDAAAVLAEIDFRDRSKNEPGLPVATRFDLIAALQGFVGRDAVDKSLKLLEGLKWIKRSKKSMLTRNQTNLKTHYEFALNVDAIAAFLNSGKPGFRHTGPNPERAAEDPTIKEKEEELEAPPGVGGLDSGAMEELRAALEYRAKKNGKQAPAAWADAGVRRCSGSGEIGPGEKEAIAAWRRHQEEANATKTKTEQPVAKGPPPGWKADVLRDLARPKSC